MEQITGIYKCNQREYTEKQKMCQFSKHGDNSTIKTKALNHLPSEQQWTNKAPIPESYMLTVHILGELTKLLYP
jgi:hypothetical protein